MPHRFSHGLFKDRLFMWLYAWTRPCLLSSAQLHSTGLPARNCNNDGPSCLLSQPRGSQKKHLRWSSQTPKQNLLSPNDVGIGRFITPPLHACKRPIRTKARPPKPAHDKSSLRRCPGGLAMHWGPASASRLGRGFAAGFFCMISNCPNGCAIHKP